MSNIDPKDTSPGDGASGGTTNVVSLEERLKAAEARAAKAEAEATKAQALADANAATLEALKKDAKVKLIEKAQMEGRVVPANLKAITKLADAMDEAELEGYLAELPTQMHARAKGIADRKVSAPSVGDEQMAAYLGMSGDEMNKLADVVEVYADGRVKLADGTFSTAKKVLGTVGRA